MSYSWDRLLADHRGKDFKGEWPTIIEMFMMSLHAYGERPCFTTFDPERHTLTYQEVAAEVLRVSSWLQEQGLKSGDRVLLNGKNSIAWGITYLSVQHAGGVIVPLDNQMHADRVMTLGAFSGARFLFADKDVIDKLPNDVPWRSISLTGGLELNIEDIKASKGYAIVPRSENDLAAILYTSGTTGNEKGVMLSEKNIISDVYQAADDIFLHVTEQDVLYALLPLHHSYCCTAVLLESVKHGAECVFGHGIVVSRMINDMKKGKVTVFMGIPLLYNKILAGMMKEMKKKGFFVNAFVHLLMTIGGSLKLMTGSNPLRKTFNKLLLSKLGLDHNKLLICGAGPLSPKVFKQYQQLGLDFVQGYGLTETSPIITLNPISHFKIDSVGMVFPLDEVIIADPDEKGVGEIRVKGPNVTSGYYHDEEHTKELFDENGYLRTGDLGSMDSEHYVYLKGRAKNLIVTEGGKNVYPEEIEDLFQPYGEVEQILIRGYQEKKDVPSENIEAVIYPSEQFRGENAESTMDRIVKEVNTQLSGYKKISKVTVVKAPMAMTTTQKIKRNQVK